MRWSLLVASMASAGCVPQGRQEVELPVVLSAVDQGPWDIEGVEVSLDRAVIEVADLLVADREGRPMAAWAGQRRADLLGQPGPHGTMLLYDGEAVVARFSLRGAPAVSLSGALGDGRRFAVEASTRREVAGVVADIPVDADAPVARVLWTVDLGRALEAVDWASIALDDDAAFQGAVMDGLADPEVWRLDADR